MLNAISSKDRIWKDSKSLVFLHLFLYLARLSAHLPWSILSREGDIASTQNLLKANCMQAKFQSFNNVLYYYYSLIAESKFQIILLKYQLHSMYFHRLSYCLILKSHTIKILFLFKIDEVRKIKKCIGLVL